MFERLDYNPLPRIASLTRLRRWDTPETAARRYPEGGIFWHGLCARCTQARRTRRVLFERAWRFVSGSRAFIFVRILRGCRFADQRGYGVVELALAWAGDPLARCGEVHRVLIAGGLLMFSSYGPDTLKETQSGLRSAESARHVHSFIDMHDSATCWSRAICAPVMDMEVIT